MSDNANVKVLFVSTDKDEPIRIVRGSAAHKKPHSALDGYAISDLVGAKDKNGKEKFIPQLEGVQKRLVTDRENGPRRIAELLIARRVKHFPRRSQRERVWMKNGKRNNPGLVKEEKAIIGQLADIRNRGKDTENPILLNFARTRAPDVTAPAFVDHIRRYLLGISFDESDDDSEDEYDEYA